MSTSVAEIEVTDVVAEGKCQYPGCDRTFSWLYHHKTECKTYVCDEHVQEARDDLDHFLICPAHHVVDCRRCGTKDIPVDDIVIVKV